jgi:hypothetical protein
MKEKTISTIEYILRGFVLVTIGFAIGKEVTLRRMKAPATAPTMDTNRNGVMVYYAHATIRCVSCETIERLTQETLDEQFGPDVAAGRVVFKEINFQENTAFARQYEIVANCVIVSRMVQGQETRHQRLDKVWELYENPPAFKQYLGDAIRAYLHELPGDNV